MNSVDMHLTRRSIIKGLALSSMPVSVSIGQESAWPTKPVKVIVPYSPGGSSDALGRLVTQGLSDTFKQNFVVENKGGAGGMLGSQQVAKLAPDGYNLLVSGVASHVIGPAENPKLYDPIKDFTHIAILGGPPIVLAVNADVPASDLPSFIAYAKKTAKGISWGSPGKGTHGYLIGESFELLSKTPMEHIAYKGAAPAVVDLLAGHISASFTTLSTASPHIHSGKLRALAVTSTKRLAEFPNVPTFAELGYPKLVALTWFSLSGPPGMSPTLVAKINQEVRKIMQAPHAKEVLNKASMETFDWDSARFNQFVADEIKQWGPLVKAVQ
jgi:tripartite-type tricarboxylate transporter receptor subunit TctC